VKNVLPPKLTELLRLWSTRTGNCMVLHWMDVCVFNNFLKKHWQIIAKPHRRTPVCSLIIGPCNYIVRRDRPIDQRRVQDMPKGRESMASARSASLYSGGMMAKPPTGSRGRDPHEGLGVDPLKWNLLIHFHTKEGPKVKDLNDCSPPCLGADCFAQPQPASIVLVHPIPTYLDAPLI